MVEALGGFDPQAVYDQASIDYEDASQEFWQYLSARTVERLALQAGERVLDVPCGTGPGLLAAAPLVGPSGHVAGVDYAEQMLAIAGDKVRERGLANVDLRPGDMTVLAPSDPPYDAVLCVLGIFFVDDMPALARSFHGLLNPAGGRLAMTVFGERFFDPLRDVFVEAVHAVAPGFDVVQPWCRTEREDVLRRIFQDAGLPGVTIETDDDELPLRSADDWWRIVMGSGLRRTAVELGPERAAEVRARCDRYIADNGVDAVVSRSRYAIVRRC